MRVLLVTPPMTQLNTPYPATAYLTGFLRLHAADLGPRGDAGRRVARRCSCGCSRAPLVERMADELRQRARSRRQARCRAAADRAFSRTCRALRRHGRAGDPLPATPRSRAWHCESSDARFFPKGRALSRPSTEQTPSRRVRHARAPPSRRATSRACTSTTWRTSGALGIDPRFELARYAERLAASAAVVRPAARGADRRAHARRRDARRAHARAASRGTDPTSSP